MKGFYIFLLQTSDANLPLMKYFTSIKAPKKNNLPLMKKILDSELFIH